jgi:vacuolar-type H+-ATPase subunit B/Vma2
MEKVKSWMLYIYNIKCGKYNKMCEINNEVGKMRNQKLVTIGSVMVVLGIIFGEDRLISYSFIGVGVLLSIISAFKSRRNSKTQNHRTGGV